MNSLGGRWDQGHRASVELKADRAYFETGGGLVSTDDDHPGISLPFPLTAPISSRTPFAAKPREQKVYAAGRHSSLVACGDPRDRDAPPGAVGAAGRH